MCELIDDEETFVKLDALQAFTQILPYYTKQELEEVNIVKAVKQIVSEQ